LFLWPNLDGYVDQLAYQRFTDDSLRTSRWAAGFTLTLEGELANMGSVIDKAHEVAEEVQRATGLAVNVGPGGACVVRIDASILDSNAVGRARLRYSGATIIGATLSFAGPTEITGGIGSDWRNTFLHEMGHALGLSHSPNDRDVMTPGAGPGTKVAQFSERETSALHMMYQHRAPGNWFPDKDPQLASASSARPVVSEFVD